MNGSYDAVSDREAFDADLVARIQPPRFLGVAPEHIYHEACVVAVNKVKADRAAGVFANLSKQQFVRAFSDRAVKYRDDCFRQKLGLPWAIYG